MPSRVIHTRRDESPHISTGAIKIAFARKGKGAKYGQRHGRHRRVIEACARRRLDRRTVVLYRRVAIETVRPGRTGRTGGTPGSRGLLHLRKTAQSGRPDATKLDLAAGPNGPRVRQLLCGLLVFISVGGDE